MRPSVSRLSASLLALALAAAADPGLASTPNTGPKPWDPVDTSFGASPTTVTGYVEFIVTGLREDDRLLAVWDEESETEHFIRLSEQVEIKPRRKKEFGGRAKLDFEDLSKGHRLKLKYRVADGAILEVKVLERVKEIPQRPGG